MTVRTMLLSVLGSAVFLPLLRAEDLNSGELERWIKQLGSPRHRERESAATALGKQRTARAIVLLRKAAESKDPEVSRRARETLDLVERALETDRLLQPNKLTLRYKDVRLADVVADFARITGLKIALLDADTKKLADRRITMEAVEVGAWEALRILCDKAGVHEMPPAPTVRNPEDAYQHHGRRRVFWGSSSMRVHEPIDERILLADGKTSRPMFLSGALRVQAVARPLVGPPHRNAHVTLGVDLDARFAWNRLVSIRIDGAVDEHGRKASPPAMMIGDMPAPPQEFEEMLILWDGMEETPSKPSRQGTIKLDVGDKGPRTLKELRGRVAVEVESPPETLVTVTDVLKSAGKTFRGHDGARIKVLEAVHDADQYMLKVEVTMPPDPAKQNAGAGNLLWMNPALETAGTTTNVSAVEVAQKGLALYDADGQPYLLATGCYLNTAKPHEPKVWTLYYQPRGKQGDPVRFVLTGKRTVVLDVPFVLTDVPIR